MIADPDTNIVFVADTLEREFPSVASGLRSILERHGIPLSTIPGTRSVWCRDYMPIQTSKDRFVQFRYEPDYLTGKYLPLRADGQIGPHLPHVKNCTRSEIVLDGGNVVGWGDKVILCDKVFAENPDRKRPVLLEMLEQELEVDHVIVIPTEPGDVVGHADGIVRFIKGDVVLANDYSEVDRGFQAALTGILTGAGLEVVQLPYRPRAGRARAIPSAFGCYINYLRVGRLVVLPRFGISEDDETLALARQVFADSSVESLDCSDLSEEGGVLNCVTWTIGCESGD